VVNPPTGENPPPRWQQLTANSTRILRRGAVAYDLVTLIASHHEP
jgi:hypothetical protein